jgi:PAS domain S-box-containing protein
MFRAIVGGGLVSATGEFRLRHRDGSWRVVHSISSLRTDESGHRGLVVCLRDVTEERRLAADRARLEEALDAVPAAVFVLDGDDVIQTHNRAARELAGQGTLLGKRLADVRSRQPFQKALEIIALARTKGSPGLGSARDKASGRWWEIAVHRAGEPSEDRMVLVASEITDKVELRESARRHEVTSAVGTLIGGVAHEVRNPLFGLSATVEAFEKRLGGSEEYRRYLQNLRKGLSQLGKLMEVLLDYGRPSRSYFYAGSIEAVIAQAVRLCAPLAEQSGIQIENRVTGRFPSMLMDSSRMVQVFRNLIENAIQHSPPQSTVTLGAEESPFEDSPGLRCWVRDRGPGFNPEALRRVFEPFYTRRRGGTGLGLSIVHRVVEDHSGRVSASNHPDGGSLMEVWLPLIDVGAAGRP